MGAETEMKELLRPAREIIEMKQFPYIIVNNESITNMKQFIDRIAQFKDTMEIVDDGNVAYSIETEFEDDNKQDKIVGARLVKWGRGKTEYISMSQEEYTYFRTKFNK